MTLPAASAGRDWVAWRSMWHIAAIAHHQLLPTHPPNQPAQTTLQQLSIHVMLHFGQVLHLKSYQTKVVLLHLLTGPQQIPWSMPRQVETCISWSECTKHKCIWCTSSIAMATHMLTILLRLDSGRVKLFSLVVAVNGPMGDQLGQVVLIALLTYWQLQTNQFTFTLSSS